MVSIRFVLVRPGNALNIGAAARAMTNFGLDDLAVVDPYLPRWRSARSAVYGAELLRRAKRVALEEALADRDLVLATASAHNRALLRPVVTLPALAPWLKRRRAARIAVLFGSERNGLSNAELDRCHAIVRIPTAADAPSMNLGQAVALLAYDVLRSGLERTVREPEERRLEGEQLEGLVEAAMRAMARTGVNAQWDERARRGRCRRGLLSWKMSRADASWLRGLLERLMRA